MIKIGNRAGHPAPLIVCDICGDVISKAREGVAAFDSHSPERSRVNVVLVHKGRCHEVARDWIGEAQAGWHELGEFLVLLCLNVGIDGSASLSKIK